MYLKKGPLKTIAHVTKKNPLYSCIDRKIKQLWQNKDSWVFKAQDRQLFEGCKKDLSGGFHTPN